MLLAKVGICCPIPTNVGDNWTEPGGEQGENVCYNLVNFAAEINSKTMMKQNSSLYILLLVGFISAFGPFVTDFYLPALPALSDSLHTSTSMVQLTLTVSMVGLAVGQLFIGPLSDRYGRKMPLLASLVLFILSTVGCLTVTTIGPLILYRFIQGIAGAGGVVISKSIATDLYKGQQLARFFSMLSSVQGLAPICAPILGGLLLTVTDWRGIFCVLLVIGIGLLLMVFAFRESLQTRVQGSALTAFRTYLPVVRNRVFMRYVLVQAMAMGAMFAYIASSPFIFQVHYGLSPLAYSLCFGLNALGIMAGSLLILRFRRTGHALRVGAAGFAAMSLLVAAMLIGGLGVWLVEGAFFLLLAFLGMMLPTSTTLALEPVRGNSGSASAVLGFLTFFAGGVCSPLAGLGNICMSTSVVIVVCAACSFLLARKDVRV